MIHVRFCSRLCDTHKIFIRFVLIVTVHHIHNIAWLCMIRCVLEGFKSEGFGSTIVRIVSGFRYIIHVSFQSIESIIILNSLLFTNKFCLTDDPYLDQAAARRLLRQIFEQAISQGHA